MADTKEYRFVGSHADTLASGRPVEPGEYVDLTDEDLQDSQNAMLKEKGDLMLIEDEDLAEHEIATEAAKQLAAQAGIDLANVPATGASGLITKGDVEDYIADTNGGEG